MYLAFLSFAPAVGETISGEAHIFVYNITSAFDLEIDLGQIEVEKFPPGVSQFNFLVDDVLGYKDIWKCNRPKKSINSRRLAEQAGFYGRHVKNAIVVDTLG